MVTKSEKLAFDNLKYKLERALAKIDTIEQEKAEIEKEKAEKEKENQELKKQKIMINCIMRLLKLMMKYQV